MLVLLYVALAWIAIDVLVVWAWHRAHVVARRGSLGAASVAFVGPRVLGSASAAPRRSGHPSPATARPGYFQLIDA